MPADIVGTNVIVEDGHGGKRFEFQRGPIFANIILADEINRATPKTQSALLEAMSEGSVTVAKTTHKLEKPFFVLATQNPLEMDGTYPLPEAQLDRFFFKLVVDFPDHDALHTIIDRTTSDHVPEPQQVLDSARVMALRDLVRKVPLARVDPGLRGPRPPGHSPGDQGGHRAEQEVPALRRLAAWPPGHHPGGQDPRPPRGPLRGRDR
jgi:MoxR-like ATPase